MEEVLHFHGQPATFFASSQAALSSLSFPGVKMCLGDKKKVNKETIKTYNPSTPPTEKLQLLLCLFTAK